MACCTHLQSLKVLYCRGSAWSHSLVGHRSHTRRKNKLRSLSARTSMVLPGVHPLRRLVLCKRSVMIRLKWCYWKRRNGDKTLIDFGRSQEADIRLESSHK